MKSVQRIRKGNVVGSKDKKLDEQLKKTSNIHIRYDEEKEELKRIFYNTYDNPTVVSLLKLIVKIGHPADKKLAEKFEKDYNSDNFDDNEVDWFKKAYARYNEPFLKQLNSEEGDT